MMTFEVLAIIVFLNVMATIALWRQAARKPEKLNKKFRNALLHSAPITPNHQPPNKIGASAPSLVRLQDLLFFDDFRDFGDVVNCWLGDEHVGGPWRLQELPDTDLTLNASDMPDFGRRYSIFHNQVDLGTLEVSPDYRYSSQEPLVYTEISLNSVRLLSFETVRDFLEGIALHVCDADPRTHECLQTQTYIDRALTKVLWQTQRVTGYDFDGQGYGDLELRFQGSAAWYLERKQALNTQQAAA